LTPADSYWRTGLAALLAVLTATLFIKGKSSIDDINPGLWREALIGVLLAAGIAATYGAYRAIRAAYSIPPNEWLGVGQGLKKYGSWRRISPTSPLSRSSPIASSSPLARPATGP
jgi:hypothetical protein